MNSLEKNIKPYSKAMVRLLKAPVERSVSVWQDILHYQQEIQDYISQLGLELVVRKDEGFAFVRQFEDSEGNTLGLVVRRPLGFEVSVILIVLRQLLEEFDSNPTQFQVAERFMSKAKKVAKALGYDSVEVDNVGLDVAAAEPVQPKVMALRAMAVADAAPEMGLAQAAGTQQVTTTMTGTVKLK